MFEVASDLQGDGFIVMEDKARAVTLASHWSETLTHACRRTPPVVTPKSLLHGRAQAGSRSCPSGVRSRHIEIRLNSVHAGTARIAREWLRPAVSRTSPRRRKETCRAGQYCSCAWLRHASDMKTMRDHVSTFQRQNRATVHVQHQVLKLEPFAGQCRDQGLRPSKETRDETKEKQ